jgi:hypothetical protein
VAVAALCAACAGEPKDPCEAPEDTALSFVCADALGLEIGRGADAFTALTAGEDLLLHRGAQGLQHIELALRAAVAADALVIDRAMASVRPWRDGAALTPLEVGVTLVPVDDHVEVRGLLYVIADPEAWVGAAVRLDVALAPVGLDQEGRASHRGVVQWAPEL